MLAKKRRDFKKVVAQRSKWRQEIANVGSRASTGREEKGEEARLQVDDMKNKCN